MEQQDQKLETFAHESGLRLAILFGSRVNGTANDRSDYDIALLYRDPKKFYELYDKALDVLSEHLGAPAEKFDFTDLGRENILLRYQVTRNCKLLYGDRQAFLEYSAFAFRDYIDAQPLFDLERKLTEKRQSALTLSLATL